MRTPSSSSLAGLSPSSAVLAVLLLAAGGCDGAAEPRWYPTCGDPVCQGYTGPFDGVPACADEEPGAACVEEGQTCDPADDCNALLTCATEDPTAGEGGCPISRKKYKTDIHYLDDAERDAAARSLYATRLATWRYTWDSPSSRPHLGFLIDDQETSVAVTPDGEHVDLYGYSSLTVAALQAQQAQLDAQGAQLAAQAEEIGVLRAQFADLEARAARR